MPVVDPDVEVRTAASAASPSTAPAPCGAATTLLRLTVREVMDDSQVDVVELVGCRGNRVEVLCQARLIWQRNQTQQPLGRRIELARRNLIAGEGLMRRGVEEDLVERREITRAFGRCRHRRVLVV